MEQKIYVLANSPGEMSGWVAPVVMEVRSVLPDAHITVAIVSDWFSSGKEREFALKLPVDRVVGICTLLGEVWKNRGTYADRQSLVLFLGGDALWAIGLARLLKCSAMAYMPRVYHPTRFKRIFVPSQTERERAIRKGGEPDRITVVPALALDSVKPSAPVSKLKGRYRLRSEDRPVFALMAGSRSDYAAMSVNFMLDIADHLLAEYPQSQALLPVSPFIDPGIVLSVLQERGLQWDGAATDPVIFAGPGRRLRFVFTNTHDAISVADMAIVLPGTNNLQCAALGIPFIMLMPLNSIEHIPFEGLLGLLYPKFFPFNKLKKYLILMMSTHIRYMSMVNRMAGRMLAPEMRGVLQTAEVARAASELWRDSERREQMRSDLLELTRERGAARIIAEAIRENFISDQRLR